MQPAYDLYCLRIVVSAQDHGRKFGLFAMVVHVALHSRWFQVGPGNRKVSEKHRVVHHYAQSQAADLARDDTHSYVGPKRVPYLADEPVVFVREWY